MVKEALQLPVQTSGSPIVQAHTTKTAGDDEVNDLLDGLCFGVKGVDNYAPISRERIEEDNGAFLPGQYNDSLLITSIISMVIWR